MQTPRILVISGLLRVAYFGWGRAVHGWPPDDALFLPLFALALETSAAAHAALQSRKRVVLVLIVSLLAALCGCIAEAQADALGAATAAVGVLICFISSPSPTATGYDKLRAMLQSGLLTARIALRSYESGSAVFVIDGLAIALSAYAVLQDALEEEEQW